MLVTALVALRWVARGMAHALQRGKTTESARFWTRQAINLGFARLLLLGFLPIWFDDPTRP